MPCCCYKAFKIPHIANPRRRLETIRFFTKAFIYGHALINLILMSWTISIRLKLGLPLECPVAEHFYASTYMLLAVSVLTFVSLVVACRSSRPNISGAVGVRGLFMLFIIIVGCELFVLFAAIVQSSVIVSEVENNAGVFSEEKCLDIIQSEHDCCGFENLTEWQYLSKSSYLNVQIRFEEINSLSNDQSGEKNLQTTQITALANSIFPSSCYCETRRFSKCTTVYQIFTFQNSTSPSGQSDHLLYQSAIKDTDISKKLDSETVTTVIDTVFSDTCFSSVTERMRYTYVATGISAAAMAIIQLFLLIFQFVLFRNIQGTGTVADIYRTSENGQSDQSISVPVPLPPRDIPFVTVESRVMANSSV